MSRRLLARGRYPKGPAAEPVSNTSTNSQFMNNVPTTSQMPFYDPSQSQAGQNSWTQPSYSNSNPYQSSTVTPSSAYNDPNAYQENHVSHPPASQPTGYWSGTQIQQPSTSQPSWNASWNYKSEHVADNTGYTNYQQPQIPQAAEQWKQIPYTDNQHFPQHPTNYQPQQPISNEHQQQHFDSQQLGYQTAPNQHTAYNNSNTAAPNTFQGWENGSYDQTQSQSEQIIPWNYGTSQYQADPSLNYGPEMVADSRNCGINSSSDYSSYDNTPNKHLYTKSENQPAVVGSDEPSNLIHSAEQINETSEIQSENYSDMERPEYTSSTLSGFFQNDDQKESDDASASHTPTEFSSHDVTSYKEEDKSLLDVVELDTAERSGGSECSFVQEERTVDLVLKPQRSLNATPLAGFVEEPINQEVLDPSQTERLNLQPATTQGYNIPIEDSPNQQIPSESGHTSRSTSSERERVIIRPREESPFKPPRTTSYKATVIQQEVTIPPAPDTKLPQEVGKTVVQEVNLETFPDNLERPMDYEELRKQSPLYVSHKHLRSELNSSPSSLLCDNLDIPCVTLCPALVPPMSSAKSDKSESSIDSKADIVPVKCFDPSNFKANQANLTCSSSKAQESDNYDKSANQHLPKKEPTVHIQPSKNKDTIRASSPSETHDTIPLKPIEDKVLPSTKATPDTYQPVYLKDSKIDGKPSKPARYSISNSEANLAPSRNDARDAKFYSDERIDDKDPKFRYDDRIDAKDPKFRSDERIDSRYRSDHREPDRQRFSEQRYQSFDDRQYYSDRERSRPSSRSSLRERPGEYSYPPYDRGDQRQFPSEYGRPSSRMSESGARGSERQGYYPQGQPYGYPQTGYPDYQRVHPNQREYEYNAYQRDPYYQSYYDAYRQAYSNYNYGFYDELYRNDPRYKQYQEQCRQYYAKYGYDVDYDRSSVHSGRSSTNEFTKDLTASHYQEPDIDSNESEISSFNLEQNYSYEGQQEISNIEADQGSTPSSRYTPLKFSYTHPIARFSPGGLLITVIPNQMSTSSTTPIRIHNLQLIREDEESFQELKSHQGPLVKGLTHKNDVIEFCNQEIKSIKAEQEIIDRDSHILVWELMVLLLRQNGSVVGSDIAELLLKDHEVLRPPTLPLKPAVETPLGEHSPADVNDSSSQSHAGDTSSPDEGIVVVHDKALLNTLAPVDVDKVTRKFREFLLFGHKKDALEWAMKHDLWGHALFLASKMDTRTYANVMTRFANSLALNDPLQTLYQLMSGRQPLAVTNVADKKWGDWRPHLAMILSNPSALPDVDSRSITTLGDTLKSKGCLCAAHFCYIMSQVEFGTFEQKESKFVLLTANHELPFEEFAVNKAIQITEIYEYAQSLANPGFVLVHLQFYKYLYALRLVDHGFYEEALHYCEVIAGKLQEHPHLFQLDFITDVFKLATQLKYHDPHFLRGQGEFEDQDDPDWLKNLSALVINFNNYSPLEQTPPIVETATEMAQYQSPSEQPSSENTPYYNVTDMNAQNQMNNYNNGTYYNQNEWNRQNQQNAWNQQNNLQNNAYSPTNRDSISTQNSFHHQNSLPSHEENETTDVPSSPVTQTPPFDYFSGGNQHMQESKSSYNANNYNNTSQRERRDSALSSGSRYSTSSISVANKNSKKESTKTEAKKEKPTTQAGKTWLGGIFSRLLPRGPNQMILPDDKNPTIVWDEGNQCWMNNDSNDDEGTIAPVAPPTDMELMGSKSSIQSFQFSDNSIPPPGISSAPGATNTVPPTSGPHTANKFQRPKTRGMRQNYVDVLSSSGSIKKTNIVPEALFPAPYESTSSPQMFTPMPTSAVAEQQPTDLGSNNASYSSPQLENEGKQVEPQTTPMMFNPATFESSMSGTNQQRHSFGQSGRRTYPT